MIYVYHCVVCNIKREIIKPLAEIDRVELCLRDDFPMERVICAPAIAGDFPGYPCPITGKWIEGRRAHEENLRKHGCRILEPGETNEAAAARKHADHVLEQAVAEDVGRTLTNLPQEKLEALETGLANGLDFSLQRSSPTPGG